MRAVPPRWSLNVPVPLRRRHPLTVSEAAYFVDRFGRRSLQTMSAMTGVSQSSVRRTVPLAERGVSVEPPKTERPRRATERPLVVPLRTATLSFTEAGGELGVGADVLYDWLIQERWIRRGRRGALIAGATKLTAGLLNQTVEQVEEGRRVHMHYGAIRFTPRGMSMLRTGFQNAADQCR